MHDTHANRCGCGRGLLQVLPDQLKMFLSLLQTLLCLCCLQSVQPTDIHLEVSDSSSAEFKLYVDGKEWFRSGVLGVRHKDVWWSSEHTDAAHSLIVSEYAKEEGSDLIGDFSKHK